MRSVGLCNFIIGGCAYVSAGLYLMGFFLGGQRHKDMPIICTLPLCVYAYRWRPKGFLGCVPDASCNVRSAGLMVSVPSFKSFILLAS